MHVAEEPFIEGQWLESKTSQYKQANQPHRRGKWLNLVGAATGLSGLPWAALWLRARKVSKLSATPGKPFMPNPQPGGGWETSRLTLWDLTLWLRESLLRVGATPDQLLNVGSHSCKATPLSWGAKFGLRKDDRKLLGGHIERADVSVVAYSRDTLAGPLRKLMSVYKAIREEKFLPDEDRSGRWALDEKVPSDSEDDSHESQSSSSSSGSDSDQDSEAEVARVAEKVAVLRGPPKKHSKLTDQEIWRHHKRGT